MTTTPHTSTRNGDMSVEFAAQSFLFSFAFLYASFVEAKMPNLLDVPTITEVAFGVHVDNAHLFIILSAVMLIQGVASLIFSHTSDRTNSPETR